LTLQVGSSGVLQMITALLATYNLHGRTVFSNSVRPRGAIVGPARETIPT
jgi:hypothetical protein